MRGTYDTWRRACGSPILGGGLTKDVMRVTCVACMKHKRCRTRLLLLSAPVREHVAVLLDWVFDHPDHPHPLASAGPPVSTLLKDLARCGFPVDQAVDTPKRMLRLLVAAQNRVEKLGQDRCTEASWRV